MVVVFYLEQIKGLDHFCSSQKSVRVKRLMQFLDFANLSLSPMVLSLKSFANSRGNSYLKCLIVDIKFCFTCGK